MSRTLIKSAAQGADSGVFPSQTEANLIEHMASTNAIQAVAIGLKLTGKHRVKGIGPASNETIASALRSGVNVIKAHRTRPACDHTINAIKTNYSLRSR